MSSRSLREFYPRSTRRCNCSSDCSPRANSGESRKL